MSTAEEKYSMLQYYNCCHCKTSEGSRSVQGKRRERDQAPGQNIAVVSNGKRVTACNRLTKLRECFHSQPYKPHYGGALGRIRCSTSVHEQGCPFTTSMNYGVPH